MEDLDFIPLKYMFFSILHYDYQSDGKDRHSGITM